MSEVDVYKPVLVTGASSGIGEATARALASEGFQVFAGARRIEKLMSLEQRSEGSVRAVELDVNDEGSINDAFDLIEKQSGPAFGVVNNAGISVMGPVEEVTTNEWRRQFETNVFGVVAVCQRALPTMRQARAGRIINVGSVAGRIASPFQGAYASSKHALEGLTDALRREVAPFGIRVSLIRPGFIDTPFGPHEQEGLDPYTGDDRPYGPWVQKMKEWHAKGHPNGASPQAVASTIVSAMTAPSPHSRYTVPTSYIPSVAARNLLPSAVTDRLLAVINRTASVKRDP
ncbi:MAG: SDR family oxidoreductase [Pseudomonadota bacterium]